MLLLVLFIVLLVSTSIFVLGGINPGIAISLSFMNMIGASFLPYRNFKLPSDSFVLVGQLIGILGYITITIILTTFFYGFLRSIDIKAGLAKRRAKILSDHLVLNPINSFSLELASNLKQRNLKFMMVDKNLKRVDSAIDSGFIAVEEDITKEGPNNHLFFSKAKMLVLLGDDDVENVLTTIEAKKNNPNLTILARIKRQEDLDRVLHSGVAYAIMPEIAVGDEIGEFLLKSD